MRKMLYFTADWCGPCKYYKPIVEELEKEYNLEVDYIDIDSRLELASKYGINSAPQLLEVDSEGKELNRLIGSYPPHIVVDKLGLSNVR